MPHGPNFPPANNVPPDPDTLALPPGYYDANGGNGGGDDQQTALTADQQRAFGLTGGQGGQSAPTERTPRLYGGLDGAAASLGRDYAPYSANDPNQSFHQHWAGRPAMSQRDAFRLGTDNPSFNEALTQGNNRNRSTRLPQEGGPDRRGDIHLTGIGPTIKVPYRMLGWRYRGDDSRGVTHAVLDRTVGEHGDPVVPAPLRRFHRLPAEIARDTSLSPAERIVGAAAMGLAGVIVAPVSALTIGARAMFRGMRER